METLSAIGIFVVLFAGVWLITNIIRRKPKKWLVIWLAAGFLLAMIGVANSPETTSLTEKTKEIQQLKVKNKQLKAKLASEQAEVEKLITQQNSLEKQKNKEKKQLANKKRELAKEKARQVATKEAAHKQSEKQAEKHKQSEKSASTSSTSGSEKSSYKTNSETKTSESHGAIKGSKNKIYHVPGSTYYDRTTNVVQWFNTVEEAKAAGYRAPKR